MFDIKGGLKHGGFTNLAVGTFDDKIASWLRGAKCDASPDASTVASAFLPVGTMILR